MAKQVRMEDVDRISNLSDAILGHILSFLSTKEAVGTSILSTRWRYLFALVTNLDFELDDTLLLHGKKNNSRTIKSFMSFVDRVLFLRNTTSIENFRLKCCDGVDSSRVCGWLSAAVWRGVQQLDLDIWIDRFTILPGVLFTCRTLVTLKLNIFFVLNVPNDVCFPNLKTLYLRSIEFQNDDSVKRLFSNCISLEDMVIEDCYLRAISNFNISNHFLKRLTIDINDYGFHYWIVIDAPMLVHFKYTDNEAGGYSLKNLQSLVSADIDIAIMEETYSHHQADATPFFKGIRNVQSLNLSSSNLELLLSCESVPVFPNLVQLKICYDPPEWSVPCYYHFLGKGLATLLRGSPELEELGFFKEVVSYLPEKVHFGLLFKLKAIEISNFEDWEDCIEMTKYFLKNAGVLEKLTIRTKSYLTEKKKMKIAEELLASPKKSKQCCILIV